MTCSTRVGNPLGVARRDPPTRLEEILDIESDPGPLHVFDTRENLLLTADFMRPHTHPAVFIHDGKENEVGWLVRTAGVLRPKFDLRYQDRPIGSFEVADWRQRVTNVR